MDFDSKILLFWSNEIVSVLITSWLLISKILTFPSATEINVFWFVVNLSNSISRLLIFRTTNEETKKQAIYNSIVANYISSINDYRLAKSIRIYTDCQIYLKYHQLTENSKIAILSIAKKARESEVHAFVRQKMSQTYYQIFRIIKNLNLK